MLDPTSRVADVVLAHSECAPVLARLRIDYCCRGHLPLGEACAQRGLAVDAVLEELERAIATRSPADTDPRTLSTPELVSHIVARHHGYLREALPFVLQLAAKVARVHGGGEPRLVALDGVVRDLAGALLAHIDEEERDLFRSLDRPASHAAELDKMQGDHLEIARMLDTVRETTENFRVPPSACGSYRTLFAELEALEGDVMQHVHLENHVLAPRLMEA